MTKTIAPLERLIEVFTKTEPDWRRIRRKARKMRNFERRELELIVSDVSQIHTYFALEVAAAKVREEFESKICFNPIHNMSSAGGYIFLQRQNYAMEAQRKGNAYAEYDQIFSIDGRPVLCEVTLSRSNSRTNNKMSETKMAKKLEPLKKYFETDNIRCIYVICPSRISPDSKNQSELIAQGGHIVPFYADRHHYTELVRKHVLA